MYFNEMKIYKNPDTGEMWTESEIEELYNGINELQEQYPVFTEYLEHLQVTGGIVIVNSVSRET